MPEATEKISYGIPTYAQDGNLIHFGGFPTHVGLYPGPIAVSEFQDKLKDYDTSKGTIRFPHDKPLPLDLVTAITEFCVAHKLTHKID